MLHQMLLGIPGRRWEVNIRMDLKDRGWKVVDWMHLAQNRDQWRALINTELVKAFCKVHLVIFPFSLTSNF